jgi:hypothetical protein
VSQPVRANQAARSAGAPPRTESRSSKADPPARRAPVRPPEPPPAPASDTAWPTAAIPGGEAALAAQEAARPRDADAEDEYDLTPIPAERAPRDAGAEAIALLRSELGAQPIED